MNNQKIMQDTMNGTTIISKLNSNGLSFLNEDGTSKYVFDEKLMIKSLSRITPKESLELPLNVLKALNYWFQVPKKIYDSLVLFENYQTKMNNLFQEIACPFEFETQNLPYNLSDAINGYYYMHLICLHDVEAQDNKELRQLYYAKNRAQFIRRGMDLHWSSNSICPTMDEYLNVIAKSWKFLDFNFEIMTKHSKFQADVTKLSKTLLYLFSIDEDYNNLLHETSIDDDNYIGDITRGRFTFPIVHAINNSKENQHKLHTILNLRTQKIKVKKYLLSVLETCGSIEFTKNCIKYLATEAMSEIKKIGENPLLEKILSKYLD